MSERFRVMFVFRYPIEVQFLIVVGVDYDNGCLFSILLHSPHDRIQLDYNTEHYPKDLIEFLEGEQDFINSGFYDIRSWSMNLMEKQLKERMTFHMNTFDRGLKKWAPFKSLPEQWSMLRHRDEQDKKKQKPLLDEYQLEEINQYIQESLAHSTPLLFKIHEQGMDQCIGPGVVSKIDPYTKVMNIEDHQGHLFKVKFDTLIGVQTA